MSSTTRAALAAFALAVPVAVEAFWLHNGEGSRTGDLVFAASQLVGWALVLRLVRALGRDARGRLPRVVLGGVALQAAFAGAYGVSTVVSGEPWEGVFILFLLGFLLLAVGGVGWGVRLLRLGSTEAGLGLLLVGSLGFLAVAVTVSPWHDLVLLGSYVAWVLVGVGTDRAPGEHPRPGVRRAAPGRRGRAVRDPRPHHGSGRSAPAAARRP